MTPEIIEAAKRITTKAYADPGDHAYDARTVAMALLSIAALSQPGEAAEQITRVIEAHCPDMRADDVDKFAQALTRHAAERDARVRELEAFVAEVAHDDYKRETVTPANAFEYFGKANQRLVYLRDKAKALGGSK